MKTTDRIPHIIQIEHISVPPNVGKSSDFFSTQFWNSSFPYMFNCYVLMASSASHYCTIHPCMPTSRIDNTLIKHCPQSCTAYLTNQASCCRNCAGALRKYCRMDRETELPWLCDELMLHIFSYLDVQELINAAKTCQRWANIAGDRTLWKSGMELHLPGETDIAQ